MTFSKETKTAIINSQNGYCRAYNCLEKIHSVHHRLNNCRANREKFILFIHSPQNGIGLCFACHKDKSHLYRITLSEAEVYEAFLRDLKDEGVF